jgi:ribonuclease P protein component
MGRIGEKRRTESFVFVMQRCTGMPRLGITVSRKVGGAVTRNYVKRRIRESFRRYPGRDRLPSDLIVIAKVGAGDLTARAIQREFEAAMSRRCPTSSRLAPDQQ